MQNSVKYYVYFIEKDYMICGCAVTQRLQLGPAGHARAPGIKCRDGPREFELRQYNLSQLLVELGGVGLFADTATHRPSSGPAH